MAGLAVTVVAVAALDRPTTRAPDGAAGSARPTVPPAAQPPPVGTTYRDFIFETTVVTAPTATKAQSKLWYAHGSWWAGLIQPSTNRLTIFRLDGDTQLWVDTGTLIDERPFADPDFLWEDDHLYVVSAGPHPGAPHAGRVLRYSYDDSAGRFELDRNFPVTVTPGGTTAAVIARDDRGTLWVAYVAETRVWVARSDGDDARWRAPFPLLSSGTHVAAEDIASVVAFGPGRIGVMWSDQVESRVYFSAHEDGDPDNVWSKPEVVVDGLGSSDDHINLKTYPDGEGIGVIAALKTSQDDVRPANPLAPLIILAMRPADGQWSTHLVSRVRDRHTRAIVMVDEDTRQVYVAATSPARGGEILYKRTSLDAVVFDTGGGERLVSSTLDTRINNTTASKQPLTRESGLLVLASDNQTGRYLHAVVDLGAGLPPADPADPSRPDRPAPPPDPGPVPLMDNDFEPWPLGDASGTGWVVREGDPPSSLTIVEEGPAGRALRAVAAADGASVRACRDHPAVPDVDLELSTRVRVGDGGTSDSIVVSMRGSGGEAASIRVTDRDRLAWFDGSRKVQSVTTVERGAWYRVDVTVDQTARTYDFRVLTDDGDEILSRKGSAWRFPDVETVRRFCLETASGTPGQSVDLAEFRLQQVPSS